MADRAGDKEQKSVPGRFLATIEENALLASGDHVLAGVSGGADSVCLLDLLRLVRPRLSLTLSVFHLNHGLRDSSARDEEFVRRAYLDVIGSLPTPREARAFAADRDARREARDAAQQGSAGGVERGDEQLSEVGHPAANGRGT